MLTSQAGTSLGDISIKPKFLRGRGGGMRGVGGIHGGDWGGACVAGVCMAGGMHGRGTCMAGETATAPGGAFLLHLKFDLHNVR